MNEVVPYRLAEVLGSLPILHMPQRGPITVGVVGPLAHVIIPEVQKWRDVSSIFTLTRVNILNKGKIKQVENMPIVDVLLLSPEQSISTWVKKIKPGGIIQSSTSNANKFWGLLSKSKDLLGNGVPWREHLPTPLYGVLGRAGIGSAKRCREPLRSSKRLNSKYLPCLFTFGKDEIPLAFKGKPNTIEKAGIKGYG